MKTNKWQAKIFLAGAAPLPSRGIVEVFHRWIQTRRLPHVLIDVADYTHVWQGPGVQLIGHEADVGVEETDGRWGLVFARKRGACLPAAVSLAHVVGLALQAAQWLQNEPELEGLLHFRGDEVAVRINDRLAAPHEEASLAVLERAAREFFVKLYGGPVSLQRERDQRKRCGVRVFSPVEASLATLLARLPDGEVPHAA